MMLIRLCGVPGVLFSTVSVTILKFELSFEKAIPRFKCVMSCWTIFAMIFNYNLMRLMYVSLV